MVSPADAFVVRCGTRECSGSANEVGSLPAFNFEIRSVIFNLSGGSLFSTNNRYRSAEALRHPKLRHPKIKARCFRSLWVVARLLHSAGLTRLAGYPPPPLEWHW